MANSFTYDVFLSHNIADKPQVRKLAERLKKAGLRVWLDEWLIKPGDDIYLAIERGLEEARIQVLCLSPAALGSEWVTLERSTVLFRDPSNKGRRFIPLLLTDCELPDTLRRYKYVDYRRENKAAFQELLGACQQEHSRVSSVLTAHNGTNRTFDRKALIGSHIISDNDNVFFDDQISFECPEGFRLRHLLSGHNRTITRMSWAPDGFRLASAGQDGVIRIWDTNTGSLQQEFKVSKEQLQIAPWRQQWELKEAGEEIAWTPAWSRDGRLIACGYGDAVIRLWDAVTGEIVTILDGHQLKVNNVAWSPDGKVLASCADDKSIKLWDIGRGECFATLYGHRGGINTIAWNPDGQLLASASLDGTVRVWSTQSHELVKTFTGHEDIVITVVWSPDGHSLVSTSADMTIRLWNATTGLQQHIIEGHRSFVSCVAFSPDGKLLVSKGIAPDSTVRIWNTINWNLVASLGEPSDKMWFAGIAFHPNLPILATLDNEDKAIRIWDINLTSLLVESKNSYFVRYCSAKVVLIGEGAVGKTSLAHRLIDDKYVVHDRTHGMNVWSIDLPLPPDAKLQREALLWDLAGQEDYRLIHQLFLDETALALLLINPQKDDPFAEAGDWLKALDTAARNGTTKCEAARVLIFSQIDVGGMKISNSKIMRFIQEHRFAAWLATSAKTGENCSDQANSGQYSKLKQLIADCIPWDKLPWTATPRLLAELKNALLKMRDKTDIRLMRFAELLQRLEQTFPSERIEESDVRTALKLLANHGLARLLKFGDLVLLLPELLNGYAGAIIRSARAHKDEIGCVPEADIYDPKFDFTGVERLKHRPDEELLLRAMVQIFLDNSLCIAEETPQGRHLVFPSQYRREKDMPRDPDIFVSYTFNGEWQTIWTTLVVRLWYSHEFEHKELWRNAAEFASPMGYKLGLKLTHKQGEGEATLSLYFDKEVRDELKAIFIEYVHRHLVKYACEVVRDRRYICPNCGKLVKDLDAIRKRLEAKRDFITCQECDERVPLQDFIEKRLKSDLVARKTLSMDAQATLSLDTQALEQILIGHMMAICGEANQVFRPVAMADYGIDGEVEFRDNDGKISGKKIYVQLKSGDSYLRLRKSDGKEIFDVKNERHLEYWVNQQVDVYLVVRQTEKVSGGSCIRWMNLTSYLKNRLDKQSRQIIFDGVKLDMEAVWKVHESFFPMRRVIAR